MLPLTGSDVATKIDDLIGNTPMLRLALDGLPSTTTLLAKLEAANPLSSIKDRVALRMVEEAEASGELTPGMTVIESTSGNTGIALAAVAVSRGYPCVVVMPDNASRERLLTLRMLGAQVEFTDHVLGFQGCVDRAKELHAAVPGSWYACQHENTANIAAHYTTTGPEIWEGTGGAVDVLVCGVGTGGTLTGTGRYLRERNPGLRIVAVEPEGSPLLSGGAPGPHRIPGLNGGFISPVTDVTIIDDVISVSDDDAADMTRAIATTTGLLVGVSSGAAAYGCVELARRRDLSGKTVVTIFPDTGERYLSWWPA
ncbi:PLP-dependent cysteine synthase family protein [Streptosporangium sp. NBC_01756]|uniref:PLP-dependent cysteine synthase family protein n=1 Tax=Streptosporangium sp. NBC_01756 TaxID=2975950 RepID=UPI002DDC0316|nr:cysteine synthase family protein [Streptosporangium sp. NBC_01756]WSC89893.1 cysteine synthase family protein [Streptosporangium sp. NBC_01756]